MSISLSLVQFFSIHRFLSPCIDNFGNPSKLKPFIDISYQKLMVFLYHIVNTEHRTQSWCICMYKLNGRHEAYGAHRSTKEIFYRKPAIAHSSQFTTVYIFLFLSRSSWAVVVHSFFCFFCFRPLSFCGKRWPIITTDLFSVRRTLKENKNFINKKQKVFCCTFGNILFCLFISWCNAVSYICKIWFPLKLFSIPFHWVSKR